MRSTRLQLGQKSVLSVAGPLARSTSSCAYFLRAILDANPSSYDATALPFPYDAAGPARVEARPTLVIGVVRQDSHVRPHPPVQRAVEEAVEKLRQQGHEGSCSVAPIRAEDLRAHPLAHCSCRI